MRAIAAFGIISIAWSSAIAQNASINSPSFNCSKAAFADERAICSNAELSQLDNVANAGFEYIRRVYGSQYAKSVTLPLLHARQACGSNVVCIKNQQLAAIQKFQSLSAPINGPQTSQSQQQPPQASIVTQAAPVVQQAVPPQTPTRPVPADGSSDAAAQLPLPATFTGRDILRLQREFDVSPGTFFDEYVGKPFSETGTFQEFTFMPQTTLWTVLVNLVDGQQVGCFYKRSDANLAQMTAGQAVRISGKVGMPLKGKIALLANCSVTLSEQQNNIAPAAPVVSSAPQQLGTELIIQKKCQNEWAEDFRMQVFCEKQQREAVQTLSIGKPEDIPQDKFILVRRKCTEEWSNDFRMREYCERQQFDAIRELGAR